jgi:hypothetical protein
MVRLVELEVGTPNPRVGQPLRGRFTLVRGASQNDAFAVRLSCRRRFETFDANDDYAVDTEVAHDHTMQCAPVREGERWHVPFDFDVPVIAPPSGPPAQGENTGYVWYLGLRPLTEGSVYDDIGETIVRIGAVPPPEVRAALDNLESPETRAIIDDISRKSGKELLPHERARLAQKTRYSLENMQRQADLPHKVYRIAMTIGFVAFGTLTGIVLLVAAYQKVREFLSAFSAG